jgi:hypothetical protein
MTAAADALTAATAVGVTVMPGANGRLMLRAATKPPDGVVAALQRHKPAIIALLSSTPSLPATEEWLSGIERLHPQHNPGCHPTAEGWATFISDAGWFLTGGWAFKAVEAGWTAEHLFGVLRSRPSVVNWWGCLLLLHGGTILDISPTLLKFETRRGIMQSLGRPNHRDGIDIVPIWALIENRTP